jgi:acetyl esterase/lipase
MLDRRNQRMRTITLPSLTLNVGLRRQLILAVWLGVYCCCYCPLVVSSFQAPSRPQQPHCFGSLIRPQPLAAVATTTTDNGASSSSSSEYDVGRQKKTAAGAIGQWENIHGNWVLGPSNNNKDEPPRALLHFLGGAMVGAAPHITYRYLLERLAAQGYLIVATPYQLSFDHLETCDIVISRFERMAPTIARQYGALPVVGIGHSCGALLQLLITSLFPDTPRAANALISFNNKPVKEAVPLFEEVFAPLFITLAATRNSTLPFLPPGLLLPSGSSSKAMYLSLQLLKAATEGTHS